ncbi:MAG: DUF488 domain-containing protein [Candidatus Halalkalibacterium sp. M3_1C_030]
MSIKLKRAYDEPEESDGYRVLIDRIWPRGKSKEELQLDEWIKEIAPSDELRKWFGHEPEKFEGFRKLYWQELDNNSESVRQLAEISQDQDVTLVYGAKDRKHNQAVALKDYIKKKIQ